MTAAAPPLTSARDTLVSLTPLTYAGAGDCLCHQCPRGLVCLLDLFFMSFIEELWQSVFTPGTTPALIKATHGSFALLIASLLWLIYLSRSIHFVNLLVIALLLYGTVFWFIKELERTKLMSNEELDASAASENSEKNEQNKPDSEELKEEQPSGHASGQASGKSTGEKKVTKRKV